MKLENQVVSLDLAKKLKELGVKQESLFYWSPTQLTELDWSYELKISLKEVYKLRGVPENTLIKAKNVCSAFTVAELGKMLPNYIMEHRDGSSWDCNLIIEKTDSKCWSVYYQTHSTQLYPYRGENLADLLAKMLVYLLEKGLVTPSEKGKRE